VVCSNDSRFLQAYLDGELDLVRSLETEEHLKTCPDCSQQLWSQQTLRKAFRSSNLYERAPDGLAARIRASISQEGARETAAAPQPTPIAISKSKRPVWNWLAVAAAIILVTLFTWRIIPKLTDRLGSSDLVAQELVAGHIRSLQPGHLFDVQSTDQHTVKPWFNGKLDFSPPVRDLADDGFPLIGGRLDYIDHRAVAALVYQRRQHLINVFIWPADEQPGNSLYSGSRQGYNMILWERGGMYMCAVSDINIGELQQFTQLLQK
jgi:anti-sigma factor RsiW